MIDDEYKWLHGWRYASMMTVMVSLCLVLTAAIGYMIYLEPFIVVEFSIYMTIAMVINVLGYSAWNKIKKWRQK